MNDESNEYKAWLAGLKAGVTVLIYSPDDGHVSKKTIDKVGRGYAHIGATRFAVKSGEQIRERHARQAPDQLQPLSRTDLIAAHNARVLHAKMVASIEKTDWRRLTIDQLGRIAAIIGEVQS